MGKFHDYIPSNDAAFDAWFNSLVEYVLAKVMAAKPEWAYIPVAEAELLANACTAWHSAYLPTLKPHIPAETLAKDEARAAAEAVIRPFVGQWPMWKQVSDQQRMDMGLHNPVPRRQHVPPPATVPELSPKAGLPRQVVVPTATRGGSPGGSQRTFTGSRCAGRGLTIRPPM